MLFKLAVVNIFFVFLFLCNSFMLDSDSVETGRAGKRVVMASIQNINHFV